MKYKQTFDVRGKSLNEVTSLAETQMRELVENKLLEYESLLRSKGCTPAELSAEMKRARADMEVVASENLVKLRAWLARGGETAN